MGFCGDGVKRGLRGKGTNLMVGLDQSNQKRSDGDAFSLIEK
jgi:hypothetical protein